MINLFGFILVSFKGLALEGAMLVTMFIRLMTPNGAMILRSKDCHNEVIITSLLGVIKRPIKDNI